MSKLFEPFTIRGVEFTHRGWVSPMCQYSAGADATPNDWHLVHLGQFALGGAALVLTEATAVVPEGRISPQDTGIYTDEHVAAWSRVVSFIKEHGQDVKTGIQLAHAGRKASTYAPSNAENGSVPSSEGGWGTVAPSAEAFPGYATPREMSADEITEAVQAFADAAKRSVVAGFDVIEIHAAHGYLLHQFLSPLSNKRDDEWGGSEENRFRFPLAVIEAVRGVLDDSVPLFVRVSASDWLEGGLEPADLTRFSAAAKALGVDLIDVSSGGLLPAPIEVGPGYQTAFSQHIRSGADIATSAVGMITDPVQAEHLIVTGQADAVMIARQSLRDPHWWHRAAWQLGAELPWVPQYQFAQPRTSF